MYAALGQTPPEPQGRGIGGRGGSRRGNGQSSDAGATAPATAASVPPAPPAARTSPASTSQPAAGGEGSTAPPADAASASTPGARGNRMQNMSPEQRDAMTARRRERGVDPNAAGGRGAGPGGATGSAGRGGQTAAADGSSARRGGPAAASPSAPTGASTIDALFAPLPRTETFGRAFVYADMQLKPVRLRLGITDGQNTELIDGDVQEGAGVVTNVVIPGQTSTRPAATAFPGFGQPQRGGFGGPGGGFAGGGRGR